MAKNAYIKNKSQNKTLQRNVTCLWAALGHYPDPMVVSSSDWNSSVEKFEKHWGIWLHDRKIIQCFKMYPKTNETGNAL